MVPWDEHLLTLVLQRILCSHCSFNLHGSRHQEAFVASCKCGQFPTPRFPYFLRNLFLVHSVLLDDFLFFIGDRSDLEAGPSFHSGARLHYPEWETYNARDCAQCDCHSRLTSRHIRRSSGEWTLVYKQSLSGSRIPDSQSCLHWNELNRTKENEEHKLWDIDNLD